MGYYYGWGDKGIIMITSTGTNTTEYRGLSTDEKPINYVGNGSIFFEMDTLKIFMFDGENKKWLEIANKD